MDIWIYAWIAIMGIVPPAITSAIVGYLMYRQGKRNAERMFSTAKAELTRYMREDAIDDLAEGITAKFKVILDDPKEGLGAKVRHAINGIIGPIGRTGTQEGREAALDMAREKPELMALFQSVAARSGMAWVAKQLGIPKKDALTMAGVVRPQQLVEDIQRQS